MCVTSRRQHIQGLLLAMAFSVETATAIQQSFVWGFNTFKGTSLPECARLQIFVGTTGSGITTSAQPPFTLIAYEASGITTTQLVGSDLSNLWWNVDHTVGSQLVLNMADSAGNSGGIAEDLYTVSSGVSNCHAQNPTSPVSITTNTTKTITSCDILPLKITGGTRPYTFTVAALGSTTVTNVTLGAAFDTYNWVNRASPGTTILAAVSDAQGIYAPSTGLLSTVGSADLTCGGRESTEIDSTGQASAVQSGTAVVAPSSGASASGGTANNGDGSKSSTSTTTIIAGAVGGAVLILALVAGALFFLRRRKAKSQGPRPYASEDPYNSFGLGKVGGLAAGQNAMYTGIPPHAEEITPFVAGGGQASPQATPYRDHPPYQNSTYSSNYSGSSDNTLGPQIDPRNSSYTMAQNLSPRLAAYPAAQNLPSGSSSHILPNFSRSVASPPATASVSSFDPYSSYAGAGHDEFAVPTSPSVTTSGPSGQSYIGAMSGKHAGSVADSVRTGEAGPSTTRLAVTNPTEGQYQDEKQGPVPPPPRQESVYQHEDVADVVELPPAYKERTE